MPCIEIPCVVVNVKLGFASHALPSAPAPLFVVIIMTPFPAELPYSAVDAASFKTVRDCTSAMLMFVSAPLYGAPSTIISGAELAFTDPIPRMRIEGAPAPGLPEPVVICSPDTEPASAEETLVSGRFSISFDDTAPCDPTKLSFFTVPYATTTT